MRGWLRQLRKDRGLTQREVAARLGICQSYYGYIETSAAEDMEKNPGERS